MIHKTCQAEIVVIGAGPAGLTTALELVSKEKRVTVLEKDPQYVGGLARTIQYHGYRFDLGGHRFFSKNHEISKWWRDRLPDHFIRVKRKSRICYQGRFYNYPLRIGEVLFGLGFGPSLLCLLSYLRRYFNPIRNESSFEDWVINRFGDRLYHIFFKTYTEKVWGRPCSQISSEWASQRIKGLSLKEVIFNALQWRNDQRKIKTLISEFDYPRFGPGQMWEQARSDVERLGGQVMLGREVKNIWHENNRIVRIGTISNTGEEESWTARQFIVSMPLRDFVLSIHPSLPEEVLQAARALTYRDFIVVVLMVNRRDLFSDNWIYIHDPMVRVGRIQNLNNWSKDMIPDLNTTCLELEYFCSKNDDLWKMDDAELILLAKREIEQLRLAVAKEVIDACVVRVEKAYPVYDPACRKNVVIIRQALDKIDNLQVVGRNGMHKYNNQDHSMLTGILAARNLDGGQYNLWAVNTDAEYLESEENSKLPAHAKV